MQTHKFKWKLFDIEYSSVKISETWERLRMDSDFYDFIYLSRIEKVKTKNFDTLWNNLSVLTDYHANWSYLILNQNVEIKSEKDYALMIRTTDLENNNFENDVKYVSESAYNFLTKTKVYWWEIIINKIWSAWKVYLMPELNRPVSLWMNAFLLRTNERVLEKYLYIYLHTHFWEKIIQQKINWAVPLSIDKASVRDIVVPIPSQPFQEKIQELVLESYKQKDLSEKLYKEAENLLLQELDLINYKPKTKNINLVSWYSLEVQENHSVTNYNILKDTDRFDAEYWDYSYFEIIEKIKNYKWWFDKLWNYVMKYTSWYAYSSLEYKDFWVPIIRINNITKKWIDLSNSIYITEKYSNKSKKDIASPWDILISMSWTIWNCALISENIWKACINQRILSINTNELYKNYLTLLLNSIIGEFQFNRVGVWWLQTNLSAKDILSIFVPNIDNKLKNEIDIKIQQSFEAKTKSKNLLEIAKKWVEIYIEEDEEKGFEFINNNV